MKDNLEDRRPRLKSLAAASAQEKRRQEFIAKQKQARRDLSAHARFLATLPLEDHDQVGQEDAVPMTPLAHSDTVSSKAEGRESLEMLVDEVETDESSRDGGAESAGARGGGGKARRRSRGSQRTDSTLTPRMMMQRDHWASQLCVPEWMLTIPRDLNGAGSSLGNGWYVMPRPEGKRVLLISSNGETVARQMCGAIMRRFSSHLPGGSMASRRGAAKGAGHCILDCVFHEPDETFFVLDMMAWKGYPLYDCTTDFRLYWVRTKLLEAEGPLDVVSRENAYRIKATPYLECNRQGLAHAYSSPVPYIKDGLLLYLKAGHYQLGPTPLVLLWKDTRVARYLGADGPQAVVLRVGDHDPGPTVTSEGEPSRDSEIQPERDQLGAVKEYSSSMALTSGATKEALDSRNRPKALSLLTSDGVQLGKIGAEGSDTYVPRAKPGELLRFTLAAVRESVEGDAGACAAKGVVGLKFDKRCSRLRPMADTWSKVLFHARLRRNQTITIEEIDAQASIQHGDGAQDGCGIVGDDPNHGVEAADDVDDDEDML